MLLDGGLWRTIVQDDLVGNIGQLYTPNKRPAEATRLFLFLLARSERRLPTRCSALLTRRCSDCFDLFFLWFLGLSIAFLFAFSHAVSLG